MNARLNRGKEAVVFIWSKSSELVYMNYYGFPQGEAKYQRDRDMKVYARVMWNSLIESGFRREELQKTNALR